jgi:hypothetical protein
MVDEDIQETVMITKFGLFEKHVMLLGLKNATCTFFETMLKVFKVGTN